MTPGTLEWPLVLLLFAMLLAPSSLPVHGGTPFERRTVKAAVAKVPACFRDVGFEPVTVQIVPSSEANAYFDFEKQVVEVNEAAIPGTALYEGALKGDAAYACTSVRQMRRFGNLDAALLHELVHHWHFDGEHEIASTGDFVSNEFLVTEFLRIRFTRVRARARRDLEVRALERQLNTLDYLDDRNAEQQARFCAMQNQLDRRLARYGFPVRYPGDGPYTVDDETGGEYFAEAVETAAFYPDVYCKAWSPVERAWLEKNLVGCLPRAPSCEHSPVSRRHPR